jgi:hypothetical protein
VAYEAGPTGYRLARALGAAGIGCVVAAPGKIERPSQDRVKTDQRDAERVLRLLMIDALHAVRVPSSKEEGLRDLGDMDQYEPSVDKVIRPLWNLVANDVVVRDGQNGATPALGAGRGRCRSPAPTRSAQHAGPAMRDAAAAGAELPARPPGADADHLQMGDCAGVEQPLERVEATGRERILVLEEVAGCLWRPRMNACWSHGGGLVRTACSLVVGHARARSSSPGIAFALTRPSCARPK